MAKTLTYRWFGFGKLPESFAKELQRERLLLLDEGVPSSVTYRHFHAPGKYSLWRRQWFSGCVAVTKIRVLALWHSRPVINVPFEDKRACRLQISQSSDTLSVAFDASLFHDDWRGSIEYQFRTPEAQRFLELLRERIG